MEPGSDSWWEQVRKLKVGREAVEAALDQATTGGDRTRLDPHALGWSNEPAVCAVIRWAAFAYVPTYASLMFVPSAFDKGGRSLQAWIARQYATVIDDDDEPRREAALYSLWVDFFEVSTRATRIFPWLWKWVRNRGAVLGASGPVPWQVKRMAYVAAARVPALHAGLARGIAGSCYDVYGSVDPAEAIALATAIEIEPELRAAIDDALRPTALRVVRVIAVDESDPRWSTWLFAESVETPSFLVGLANCPRAWMPRSELRRNGKLIGTLVHCAFPFDREIRHQVTGDPEASAVLYRIEGDPAVARAAIGEDVMLWPPGLYREP